MRHSGRKGKTGCRALLLLLLLSKKLAEDFYNDKEVMLSQEGSREQVVGSLERGKCFPTVPFSLPVGKDVEGFKDFTCKEGEKR